MFECVCPTVKSLLRNLQEDYLACSSKHGPVAAAGQTTRVLSVARILLLEYSSHSSRMLGEVDLLVTLMLHSMQPHRGDTDASSSSDGHPASGTLLYRAVLHSTIFCSTPTYFCQNSIVIFVSPCFTLLTHTHTHTYIHIHIHPTLTRTLLLPLLLSHCIALQPPLTSGIR